MPVSAAAVAERRVIERLLRANAMTPATPDTLDGLRHIETRRLHHLIAEGVITQTPDGRYFLNAPALADHLAARRRRLAIALIIVLVLMLASGLVATTFSAVTWR